MSPFPKVEGRTKRIALWVGVLTTCVVAAIAVALIVGLNGGSQDDTAHFAALDQAAARVDIGAIGTVVRDEHYGRTSISSDPPTRRIIVIAPKPASELNRLTAQRLQAAGFTNDLGVWQQGTTVSVDVIPIPSSGQLPAGTSPATVPPGDNAVVVEFVFVPPRSG